MTATSVISRELETQRRTADADQDVGEQAIAKADDLAADPAGEAADDDEADEADAGRAEKADLIVHGNSLFNAGVAPAKRMRGERLMRPAPHVSRGFHAFAPARGQREGRS
ncbi:MAG: hypothetical protein V9G24_17050 [Rhodoblastus sp.]